jgi:inosine-uridine nucleoside N-ribohydrolase
MGLTSTMPARAETTAQPKAPIPVILATDIGDDIDDTWALGFLLKCPELDLKLAVTEYGKAEYRAKLLAKFLQTTGHARVPVGLGSDNGPKGDGGQAAWLEGYSLSSYPGKVYTDGVGAIINTVMESSQPVTIIDIGPTPTLASALAREPRIAARARFVGMDGSVRLGYGGDKTISKEWNVVADVKAAQQVFTAPWDMTITPLDTCGLVRVAGERYRRLTESPEPVASAVIQNYRLWRKSRGDKDVETESSTLFDTVAVYLAFNQELCRMERLGIRVSDDGFTRLDEHAKPMNVATEWKNLDGFRDLLTNRLAKP